ncbi:hypothetical protein B0H14DRAFT_2562287 [Mycena olivaceomarginata]|nr:hypothetical protein B0H14DRAFT_2562287 [Mycena olivaceomarginata]
MRLETHPAVDSVEALPRTRNPAFSKILLGYRKSLPFGLALADIENKQDDLDAASRLIQGNVVRVQSDVGRYSTQTRSCISRARTGPTRTYAPSSQPRRRARVSVRERRAALDWAAPSPCLHHCDGEGMGAAGIGVFVRRPRLEIVYWVPRGYHTLHETELVRVFVLCPRLTHFAYNPLSGGLIPALLHLAPLPGNNSLTTSKSATVCFCRYSSPPTPTTGRDPTPGPPPSRASRTFASASTSTRPSPRAYWALSALTHLLVRPTTNAQDIEYHLTRAPERAARLGVWGSAGLCLALRRLCAGEAELRAGVKLAGGHVVHAGLRSVDGPGFWAREFEGRFPCATRTLHTSRLAVLRFLSRLAARSGRGADYVFEETESVVSEEDSDDSDVTYDEGSESEDEAQEVDREEALAIFRRTLSE